MHIIRTVIWVVLLAALLLFSVANWTPVVTVRIWEGLVVDTKIPAIVLVSFLIGFVPMWLYHRADRWRMQRRTHSLEANLRNLEAARAQSAAELETRRLEEERLARERPSGYTTPPPV